MSLRELEDNCKVNIRFMYLMNNEQPTYCTFGYFINEVLAGSIAKIFYNINQKIFETEQVDLNHIYIDVWKKSVRYIKTLMKYMGLLKSQRR